MEEFYRLLIRLGQTNEREEEAKKYVNGLKYAIQDELSMLRSRIVREAYSLSLKVEEKLSRKTSMSRGKPTSRS